MAEGKQDKHSNSKLEKEYAELIAAARARPGVREVMEVYGSWLEKDRGLDAYRSATKRPERITTTNSSNTC